MAGYDTRQSTISDGNIGYDTLWNDEYDAILAAFAALTGHSHGGSAGEGGYVNLLADVDAKNKIHVDATTNQIDFYTEVGGIAVLQFSLLDGQLLPATDSDVDIGSATKKIKALYVDSVAAGAITGATIVAASNTITTAASGNLAATELNAALAELDGQDTTIQGNLDTHADDTSTHGVTTVAGIAEVQTLTNKTIDLTDNTVTGTLSEFNTAVSDDDLAGLGAANTFTQINDFSTAGIYLGTAASANLLDDYETGTWTPTIQDDTLSDAEGQTYSSQTGRYTKIGDVVYVQGRITVTSLGTLTATDQARIAGLPFTTNTGVSNRGGITFTRATGLTLTVVSTPTGITEIGGTTIELRLFDGLGGSTALLISEIGTAPTIYFTGTYKV